VFHGGILLVLSVERFVSCAESALNSEVAQDARIIPRPLLFLREDVREAPIEDLCLFIFERCERNTVLVASINIAFLRAGLLELRLTEFEDRAEAKTIASPRVES
jgi:hypothetical protein